MRWLARCFARIAMNRVATLILFFIVAVLGVQNARASSCPNEGSCDRGEAYSAAWALSRQHAAKVSTPASPRVACEPKHAVTTATRGSYTTVVCYKEGGASGGPQDGTFYYGKQCSDRNSNSPIGDKAASSPMPWPNCVAGCKVQQQHISFGQPGGVMLYGRSNGTYLDETCTAPETSQDGAIDTRETKEEQPKKSEPECTALGGGQTACYKPDGEYCATASTGKSFCWQPQESGKKVDGGDAQVKSKAGDQVLPPDVKIEDKDWQRKEGHQATACVNNTCITYNVTNFQTVPGGTAKNSTGDNKADGSGNTSGNGTPKDGEGDNDDGDSASDSGSCEIPPACTGNTLKCLHLRYTWKIECNSRSSEIKNGDGCGANDVPTCAGNSCKAEAYSQLLQQWKQRCAMQAMGEGMAARAAAIGGSNGDDAGVVDGIWGGEDGGSGLTLRRDLISVSGGGSLLPTGISIEGQAWEVPQGFYDAIAAIRMVIIAMCTVIAMFVVGRSI